MAEITTFGFLREVFNTEGDAAAAQIRHMLSAMCTFSGQERRDSVPKIHGYAEMVVPLFNLVDFKMHYRISRNTFEKILQQIGPNLQRMFLERGEVNPTKQLLIFIWYMSNQESMREVSLTFGLSKSTVHTILYRVMRAFCTNLSNTIQWPDRQRQQAVSREVEQDSGIAGVVGFIDGTHVRLAHCVEKDQDYINRKGFPSMQLQVVVDNRMLITNSFVGWPGCTHDARVLRNSQLYIQAEEGMMFAPDMFIIGDSAYPVRNWLVAPYKDNGQLTAQQRMFNRRVSGIRQVVERSIGQLKGRFRRLLRVHLYDSQAIAMVIHSACILHNLCVLTGDELEDCFVADEEVPDDDFVARERNAGDGVALRNLLVARLR